MQNTGCFRLLNQLKLINFDNPIETEKADNEIRQILSNKIKVFDLLILPKPAPVKLIKSNYALMNYSRSIYSNKPTMQFLDHNTIFDFMKTEQFIGDAMQPITIKPRRLSTKKRKRNGII